MHQLLLRHRSTPPDAFARDHDRQQVSWLAGYRLGPPSQKPESFQWHLWSSAIRLQLRGQPRICTPICAHRIPLVSPFGHYRSQTWHRIVLRVNRRNGLAIRDCLPCQKTSGGSGRGATPKIDRCHQANHRFGEAILTHWHFSRSNTPASAWCTVARSAPCCGQRRRHANALNSSTPITRRSRRRPAQNCCAPT